MMQLEETEHSWRSVIVVLLVANNQIATNVVYTVVGLFLIIFGVFLV